MSFNCKRFFNIKIIVGLALGYVIFWALFPGRDRSQHSPLTSSNRQLHSTTGLQKQEKRGCSNDILVRFYRQNDSLPSHGSWDNADHFHPELCEFSPKAMTAEDARACFQQRNVKHFMIIGDSNAMRYLRSATKVLGQAFPGCKLTRKESMLNDQNFPEPAYFTLGDKKLEAALVPGGRGCRKCFSSATECNSKFGKFTIQHIGMGMIWDQSLAFKNDSKEFSAESFQEIILKYYIPKVKPDLILLYPPFNHLRSHHYPKALQAMAKTHSSVKKYIPNTPVVWMPGFAEFEETRKKEERNRLYNGVLAADIIQRYNKGMFNMLRDDLVEENSKIMSFFDLVPISRPMLKWSSDGQHMAEIWYNRVFDYWLQTYCGNLQHD